MDGMFRTLQAYGKLHGTILQWSTLCSHAHMQDQMQGAGTLDKALDNFFQSELMEGDNAYFCDKVGERVPAIKRTLVERLPHTLLIHLKRFEYNYMTLTRFKISELFEFPWKLDMRKYTPAGAAEDGDSAPAAEAPEYYTYDLKGVVVHAGNAFAGHYYSYAKERGPGGKWYCFDDTTVTEWDPTGLADACFGGHVPGGSAFKTHSAFMLVYERKDALEPVDICAHLQPQPAPAPAPALQASAARDACSHPLPDAAADSGDTMAASPSQISPPRLGGGGSSSIGGATPGTANDGAAAMEASEAEAPASASFGASSGSVPYGMPAQLFEQIMTENLWRAQADHLTAPPHIDFLRALLSECLQLQQASDCHDVRHSMAHGSGNGKTSACDARVSALSKRFATVANGAPAPSSASLEDTLSDLSGGEPSREELAALLSLRYLLSTLVFINAAPKLTDWFLHSVESALERNFAQRAALSVLVDTIAWQPHAPICHLNCLLAPRPHVREKACLVVKELMQRLFGSLTAAAVLQRRQDGDENYALVCLGHALVPTCRQCCICRADNADTLVSLRAPTKLHKDVLCTLLLHG